MKQLQKLAKNYKALLLVLFGIGLIWDIFFIPNSTDKGLLVLIILWYAIAYLSSLRSVTTLNVTVVLLILLGIVYTFFQTSLILERLATWVYIFIFLAVIQQFFEVQKQK